MNRFFLIIPFLLILLLFNCDNICETDIKKLINSENVNDLVKGNYIIGECGKDNYIEHLFENVEDNRISHEYKFYGISVYQSKIVALKKLSGLNPPKEITSEIDTTIINFYLDWAKKNKLIR